MNWVESLILVFVIVALTLSIVAISRVDAGVQGLVNPQSDSQTIQSLETTLPLQFDFKFAQEFPEVPKFVQLNATNVLSGKPCSSMLYSVDKSSLSAVVYDCEPPGSVVTKTIRVTTFTSQQPVTNGFAMSSFNVEGNVVPAFTYCFFNRSSDQKYVYSIASDVNGSEWSLPVSVSESITNIVFSSISRLLNVDNTPTLALIDKSKVTFIRGTDPYFQTVLYTSNFSVNNLSSASIGLVFNSSSQPVIICGTTTGNVLAYVSTTNGISWNLPLTIFTGIGSQLKGIDVLFSSGKIAVLITTSTRVYYKMSIDGDGLEWPSTTGIIQTISSIHARPQLFVFDNRMSALIPLISNGVILQSNDMTGSNWPTENVLTINSLGQCTSPSICVNDSLLCLCYFDEFFSVRYGTYVSERVYEVTNISSTINLNIGEQLSQSYLTTILISNNVCIGFSSNLLSTVFSSNQYYLIYYRPKFENLNIEPGYACSYVVDV